MIEIKNLKKYFGKIKALDDVSFIIPKGKITVVAGADGSGKTTLFKILVGLIKRDSGEILIDGLDSVENCEKIRKISGYMPESFSLYSDLTVEENLNFFGEVYGVEKNKMEQMKKLLLEKTGMLEFRNRKAGALSGGMKQKLSLSSILLSSPELIILDEPTTGVDPLSRIEFFKIIEELRDEGKTIVISTPHLDEAEKGDYVVFLKNGKILKSMELEELFKTFKPKILRFTFSQNVFDVMNEIKKIPEYRDRFYLKGKYIHFLYDEGEELLFKIPYLSKEVVAPRLEDIYMYYEKVYGND